MNRNIALSTFALALGLVVLPSVSSAQTNCTFTRDLTVGVSGADVTCLQDYLTSTGHFSYPDGSTGYFGSVTRSAVAEWQKSNGISPTFGYFGPISQARYSGLASAGSAESTVTTESVSSSGYQTASAIFASTKTVSWDTTSYPQGTGVNINLLRKTSSNPDSFELVRAIAVNTSNDGQETWTPLSGETGDDLFIEVTCSTTYSFSDGCALTGGPVPVQ